MPAAPVIPEWLDQVSGVDFSPEKQLLERLEEWSQANGWRVSNGDALPLELRKRTDVLLESADGGRRVRVAVLRKSRGGEAAVRLDTSTYRTLELTKRPRANTWRVWAGGVPIADDLESVGLPWLFDLMFRK